MNDKYKMNEEITRWYDKKSSRYVMLRSDSEEAAGGMEEGLDEGELCPVCGYGRLVETPHVSLREPGLQVEGLLHMVCSHCQEWVVTPEQSRHNKRLLKAAREAHHG